MIIDYVAQQLPTITVGGPASGTPPRGAGEPLAWQHPRRGGGVAATRLRCHLDARKVCPVVATRNKPPPALTRTSTQHAQARSVGCPATWPGRLSPAADRPARQARRGPQASTGLRPPGHRRRPDPTRPAGGPVLTTAGTTVAATRDSRGAPTTTAMASDSPAMSSPNREIRPIRRLLTCPWRAHASRRSPHPRDRRVSLPRAA